MTSRSAVLTAVAAAGVAVVLLGGTATYAAWSETVSSDTTSITAGELTAEIAQSGPTSVQTGTTSGVYRSGNSQGIIPGMQAQRWTYTVSNSTDSAVDAEATLRLRGGVRNADDYAAARGYLRGEVSVEGRVSTVPPSSFGSGGLSHDVDLGTQLAPGESVSVTLTVSMPATVTDSQGRTVDVAVTLQNRRSASASSHPLFTMTNTLLLEQAASL